MYTILLIGVACAALFHRAAEYERMTPWAWVAASVALTFVVFGLAPRVLILLVAQFGLFLVLWAYNVRRHSPPKK
jgi:hypothetical protein